jgi:hypothetical protein
MGGPMITSMRISADRATVGAKLGFLAELSGICEAQGFDLFARANSQGGSPQFLELNQTVETQSGWRIDQ